MFMYPTYMEAYHEVQRRKKAGEGSLLIHKISESPYGGYRITTLPANLYADMLVGNIPAIPGVKESIFDGFKS